MHIIALIMRGEKNKVWILVRISQVFTDFSDGVMELGLKEDTDQPNRLIKDLLVKY